VSIHYHHNNIKWILYSYQKGYSGRPWAQNESPGCCQRHARVLGPVQSVAQMGSLSKQGSDPNPFRANARSVIISHVTHSHKSGRLRTKYDRAASIAIDTGADPISHSQPQNAPLNSAKQQTDGGQPRANGLPRTTRSRHQRRQVLDPNQSMNLGGVSRKWGGDQNLTEQYVVGKQNICDTAPLFIDLRPSGHPLTSRVSHGEVAR